MFIIVSNDKCLYSFLLQQLEMDLIEKFYWRNLVNKEKRIDKSEIKCKEAKNHNCF